MAHDAARKVPIKVLLPDAVFKVVKMKGAGQVFFLALSEEMSQGKEPT